MNLGEKLLSLRKSKNLTQDNVAEKLNVTISIKEDSSIKADLGNITINDTNDIYLYIYMLVLTLEIQI